MGARWKWWVERWEGERSARIEMVQLPVKVPVDAVELRGACFTAR